MVTGIVVNEKLHISRDYYKKTRAMAHQLYKTEEYFIEKDIKGTINQLEGRFAFINQLEEYDNHLPSVKKRNSHTLNGREKEYRQFIFYKYFFANPKPLIVTEGKTDILYLKAALKNLWKEYPELIDKNQNGQFKYKISFLHRSKRLKYFLNLERDGADAMSNIYYLFSDKGKDVPNYMKILKNLVGKSPINPVILLFDNELDNNNGTKKPVYKFSKDHIPNDKKDIFSDQEWLHLLENLYILMTPLIAESNESDIEMLFDEDTLSTKIDGKKFSKEDKPDTSKFYNKSTFSKYIFKNYKSINFSGFKPLLDNIKIIIQDYGIK